MQNIAMPIWPYVYGGPPGTGKIRCFPEDFIVQEMLPFEPSGSGEHAFLLIEKKSENTEYVARQLARFAKVRQRDIGFAGLKDRHAVCTQWFSVWLPGKDDPDWSAFESDNIKVLQASRHARKLKRGVLSGNRFQLLIRDWQGDREETLKRLERIKAGGIANYFGPQRFGNGGQNLEKALAMFSGVKTGREQRSIYLSAVRSYLFNLILAERVKRMDWNKPLAGDIFQFDKSQSYFKADAPDDDIVRRLGDRDIHPTGVLWGKGEVGVSGEALAIEQAVITENDKFAKGLIDFDVDLDRRAFRVIAKELNWRFVDEVTLELSFFLPAGSFATSLLREIIRE